MSAGPTVRYFAYHPAVSGVLRAAWYEPAPSGAPRRLCRDWLLVAVLVPATVLEGALQSDRGLRRVQVVIVVG